jgi:hypothetical protein
VNEELPSDQKLEIFSYDVLDEVDRNQMNWMEEIKRSLKLRDFSSATVAMFMPSRKKLYVNGF